MYFTGDQIFPSQNVEEKKKECKKWAAPWRSWNCCAQGKHARTVFCTDGTYCRAVCISWVSTDVPCSPVVAMCPGSVCPDKNWNMATCPWRRWWKACWVSTQVMCLFCIGLHWTGSQQKAQTWEYKELFPMWILTFVSGSRSLQDCAGVNLTKSEMTVEWTGLYLQSKWANCSSTCLRPPKCQRL